jgi:hypothetical protein
MIRRPLHCCGIAARVTRIPHQTEPDKNSDEAATGDVSGAYPSGRQGLGEEDAAYDLRLTRSMAAAIEQQTGFEEADEQVRQGELALLRRAILYMERTGKGLPRWAGFSPCQPSKAPTRVRSEAVEAADDDHVWRVAAGLSSGPPPDPKRRRPRLEPGAESSKPKSLTATSTEYPEVAPRATPAAETQDFCARGTRARALGVRR